MPDPVRFEIQADSDNADTFECYISVRAIDGNTYVASSFFMTKEQFSKFVTDGNEFFSTED